MDSTQFVEDSEEWSRTVTRVIIGEPVPVPPSQQSKLVFSRRGRAGDGDEEDDEPLGQLAFDVAGEPGDESLPPADGLEYLRRVRKQANHLPDVVRKDVDDGAQWRKPNGSRDATVSPSARSLAGWVAAPPRPPPAWAAPTVSWQRDVLFAFDDVRAALRRTRRDGTPGAAPAALPLEGDHAGWEAFCLGRSGPDGLAPADGPGCGRAPALSLVSRLDQPRAAGMLRALVGVLQRETGQREAEASDTEARPSPHPRLAAVGCWAYAALVRLEPDLDADMGSTVRALYTTCAELRGALGDAPPPAGAGARRWAQAATLNLLITLSGGFFRQAPKEEWQAADDGDGVDDDVDQND